jgi:hypothetical protein
MERKPFSLVYAVWLIYSIPALAWFDLTALAALSNIAWDRAGNLVFRTGSTIIYPFTYAAALLSIVGVFYYIITGERRLWAIPAALLAARASTIGTINVYEQIFTGIGSLVWSENVWFRYYGGDFLSFMWGLSGMLWIIAITPWIRRHNMIPVAIALGGFAAGMIAWVMTGYQPPDSGMVSYLLNAVTRILPHVALVLSVRR